jgi:lipid-A-disaccharide synthase
MDKEVVTELIQNELTVPNMIRELDRVLHDPKKKAQLSEDYKALRALLQQGGNASERAAEEVVEMCQ